MNIYQKIAEVMRNIKYLSKDDSVAFGNTKYKAMSEEKVTSILRSELLAQGLVVFPFEQTCSREGNITHVDVKYKMVNIDNPEEYIIIASAGDGADTQDKGSGKAMTYAFKYMFLRTFAIPTGEDPDKISSAQLDAEEAARKNTAVTSKPEVKEADLKAKVMKYANAHYTAEQIKALAGKYGKESINKLTIKDCEDFIAALNAKGHSIEE